jgi:hypothetical protein
MTLTIILTIIPTPTITRRITIIPRATITPPPIYPRAEAIPGIRDGKGPPEEEDEARVWEAAVKPAVAAEGTAAVVVMAAAIVVVESQDVIEPAPAAGRSFLTFRQA